MADNDTKLNPGGVDNKAKIPEDKKPVVGGADDKAKILEDKKPIVGGANDKAKIPEDKKPVVGGADDKAKIPEDKKPIVGGADDKAKIPEDKKPVVGGADDKTKIPEGAKITVPDKAGKVVNITFNKGKEQAGAEKKEAEAEKKTRAARMPGETKRGDKGAAAVGGGIGGAGSTPQEKTAAMAKEAIEKHGGDKPKEPEAPPPPREAPRPDEEEKVVFIKLSELHAFKNHPFNVRNDDEMRSMVESVKDKGITQPATVRPREGGGYEMVSGHRRQKASELAGYLDMPCIVKNLTDEQAITQMVEDNTTQRETILPSERAKALKMQLDAIKRQGARDKTEGNGERSNEIVAERNKMNYKTVQRYIALNRLVPELMTLVDAGKVAPATVGYQMSFLKPKNQQYIAQTIDEETAPVPTEKKVLRMRELEEKNLLNSNSIDGIMLEENKKEERQVVLKGQDLDKYFSPEKTPAEMKAVILKAMDEYKQRQPLEFGKTEKPKEKDR